VSLATPHHVFDELAEDSRVMATCEWLLVAIAAAFQWLGVSHTIWGDGNTRFDTLRQLVDQGKVSPNRYSIIHSFFSAPLYVLGKAFGQGSEFAAHFNVTLFHLSLVAFYLMMRCHIPGIVLRRTILLLLAATMFGYHVQAYYGEVLTACAGILGFSALAINRPLLAGIAMCVAVVNTPSALLGLVFCNGLWAIKTRRWFHATWPVIVAPLLVALEYWWRRGLPLRSGYETDTGWPSVLPYSGHGGFSYPLLLGVISLLFSFGKGILIYQPGLVFHHMRTPAAGSATVAILGRLGMAFSWGILLGHASWWAWHGSVFWGPRFLLVAGMPASFALAMHISKREQRHVADSILLISAIIWSVWVGVNATVIHEEYPEACTAQSSRYEPLCWYVPEYSPLIHPLVQPKPLSHSGEFYLLYSAAVALMLIVPVFKAQIRTSILDALSRRAPSSNSRASG